MSQSDGLDRLSFLVGDGSVGGADESAPVHRSLDALHRQRPPRSSEESQGGPVEVTSRLIQILRWTA